MYIVYMSPLQNFLSYCQAQHNLTTKDPDLWQWPNFYKQWHNPFRYHQFSNMCTLFSFRIEWDSNGYNVLKKYQL